MQTGAELALPRERERIRAVRSNPVTQVHVCVCARARLCVCARASVWVGVCTLALDVHTDARAYIRESEREPGRRERERTRPEPLKDLATHTESAARTCTRGAQR